MAVKAILEEVFDNAKPTTELTSRAMREDWNDNQLRTGIADLVDKNLLSKLELLKPTRRDPQAHRGSPAPIGEVNGRCCGP